MINYEERYTNKAKECEDMYGKLRERELFIETLADTVLVNSKIFKQPNKDGASALILVYKKLKEDNNRLVKENKELLEYPSELLKVIDELNNKLANTLKTSSSDLTRIKNTSDKELYNINSKYNSLNSRVILTQESTNYYKDLYMKYYGKYSRLCEKLTSAKVIKPKAKNDNMPTEIRSQIKQRSAGVCEECGNLAKHIHHKDKNRANNSLDNLIHLCIKCHCKYHKHLALMFSPD